MTTREIQPVVQAAFDELMQRATERKIQGLKWAPKMSRYSLMGYGVSKQKATNEELRIDVQWKWIGEPYQSTDTKNTAAEFRVEAVRVDDRNLVFPGRPICMSTDMEQVLNALESWFDYVPAPEQQSGTGVTDADIKRIKAIAAARQKAADDPSMCEMDAEALAFGEWTPDEAAIVCKRVAVEFPRDDDGRLTLGTTLPLAACPPIGTNEQLRAQWLAGVGPAKRRDEQKIVIGLHWIIAGNQQNRLDPLPSLWNPKLPPASQAEYWGVDGLDIRTSPDAIDQAEIDRLRKVCAGGKASAAEKAALAIRLQDAGHFGEAFALFGVTATEDVWRMVSGGMLHRGNKTEAPSWTETLREAFWRVAPWKVASYVANAPAGRKAMRHRLLALPHQTYQSKTSLMLCWDTKDRKPFFDVEGTASNIRLPEILWQRPIELDIKRFGL